MSDYPLLGSRRGIPNCPVCDRTMRLVFQFDSEDNLPFMFGDVGWGHITQCPEHKGILAFAWACS